jgi:uncharacterized protein (DUF58 family)
MAHSSRTDLSGSKPHAAPTAPARRGITDLEAGRTRTEAAFTLLEQQRLLVRTTVVLSRT